MITRCPYCHTHFRVHPDQLATRAGQVRCGKCARVFDALEYLIEEAGRSRESPSAREQATPPPDAEESPGASLPPTGEVVNFEPVVPMLVPSAESVPGATGAGAESAQMPALESLTAAGSPDAPEAASDAARFDFGPEANADGMGRAGRWLWVLGSLLLLLALLAQAAYFYRSAIIVLFPELKPQAAALCAKLGCDLPLPQRIELVSIEASDLQADTTNPNVMVLSATLRNRAIFDQQLPSVELTLTDAQDQPVVRRVLSPPDYAGKTASKQGGLGANSEIAIKVFIEGSHVKATGYRLYLFYP